jgi:hypothetical protein
MELASATQRIEQTLSQSLQKITLLSGKNCFSSTVSNLETI